MKPQIRALVISYKFPSTMQPWLANSVAQIVKQGGEVEILSEVKGDDHYTSVVDDCDLKSRTIHLDFHGRYSLKAILKNFCSLRLVKKSITGVLRAPRYLSRQKSFLGNLLSTLVLAPHINKKNINLVHSHFEVTGHRLLPIIKAQKAPFIITFHGLPPPGIAQLPQKMRAEYVNAADVILVNTEFAKRQYVQLGAPEEKIKILPQGIVTQNYSFTTKCKPVDMPIEILTVGRFSPDKGQKYVLHALPKLVKCGHNVRYTMVGTGPDRAILEQLAIELGLRDIVSFHTSISESELKKIYSRSHIFILPSLKAIDGFHEETQGVAIQEAQASGLIVIATKVGGIPECVEDGVSAFLVEDRNSHAIADKLQWIINNPDQWNQWQRDARRHVETNFDIDVIGKRLMRIYSDAITNTKKAHE